MRTRISISATPFVLCMQRISSSSSSVMIYHTCLYVLVSLALASAVLVPIEFSALESSTSQKVVIFHDPNTKESVEKLGVMEQIDAAETYGNVYEYTVCDVTLTSNAASVLQAGFKTFPQIFTQTTDGGIEPYGADFTVESFAKFHEFRMVDLTDNNVQRVKDTDGHGDVDGIEGLLALSADRPVLVKMYEVSGFPTHPPHIPHRSDRVHARNHKIITHLIIPLPTTGMVWTLQENETTLRICFKRQQRSYQ